MPTVLWHPLDEFKSEFADELAEEEIDGLVGVADETYPAKKDAKQDLYEENMRRKQEGKQPKKWSGVLLSEARICRRSAASPDFSVETQPQYLTKLAS